MATAATGEIRSVRSLTRSIVSRETRSLLRACAMLSRAVRGRGIARHGVAALRGVATTGDDRSPSDVHASGHRDAAERGDADASTSSSSSRSSSRSSSSRSSSSSAPPADFATSSSTSSSSSSRELYPRTRPTDAAASARCSSSAAASARSSSLSARTSSARSARPPATSRSDGCATACAATPSAPTSSDVVLASPTTRSSARGDARTGRSGKRTRHSWERESSARATARPVRFVDDEELAYVATRARETHDLWHVLFGCPTTVQGELALKALEFAQTGMPSAALATLAAPLRLGAFYLTLVPIRPRPRGERRSLRTFPGASLRPSLAFNPRPRRLSTPPDAFQLHPDVRSCGPLTLRRGGPARSSRRSCIRGRGAREGGARI